jgi:hypothetical protein
MAIERITAEKVYSQSVERLANRPTAAARTGQGGLSAEQVKAAYDKLPKLAISKLNELIDMINAEASDESIAAVIMTPIPTGEVDGEYKTLYEVLIDIIYGEFAGYLRLNGLWRDDLQDELELLEVTIGDVDAAADESGSLYARIAHARRLISDNAAAIRSIHDIVWSSANIGDGAITEEKISDGAVSTDKLADDSVTADKIAPGAVVRESIANEAVNGDKLAAGAVTESKLENGVAVRIRSAFNDVRYNAATGVITLVAADGSEKTIDLPIEQIITDGWFAAPYDAQSIYLNGDYCTEGGALYKCTTSISGEFNPAAWEKVRDVAEADEEIVLELTTGGVIEIPASAIGGDVVTDSTLTKAGQAADAAVCGAKFADVIARLSELEYVPIAITAISNNYSNVEIGRALSDVKLNWTLNKTPTMQSLKTYDASGALLGGMAIALPSDAREYNVSGTVNSYRKYAIEALDGRNTVEAYTVVNFLNGVYYGAAAVPSGYNSAFILALTKKLASGRGGSVNVTAGDGKYIYYCYPARFGTAAFVVGGFSGGFELVATIPFTNASGYTENYYVYKSEQAGLGALKVEVS